MTKFHIGDLLSITADCLLSPDKIDGVYKILNHLTGDNLMTHQLPLAADAMKPELLAQHPWLSTVKPPRDVPLPDLLAWLGRAADEHGEFHEVHPAPLAWGHHDPIQDFRNQWPDKPVIAVELPRGDTP